MKLITKRLTIMSLTTEQMLMYMRNVHDLERELTLTYHAEAMDGEFRDLVRRQARLCEDDEVNLLWHTFWMLNLDRELIGSVRFKGIPDREGMAELEFSVSNDFINCGYATEALSKVTDWALRQEGVKFIAAETGKDNHAAQRVLEKCGYQKYKATDKSFRWMMDACMLAKKKAEDAANAPSLFMLDEKTSAPPSLPKNSARFDSAE